MKIFFISCLTFCNSVLHGQQVTTLIPAHSPDQSLYHIARIGENEFWAGGENGILLRFDSLGNFKEQSVGLEGSSILKIEPASGKVYLSTVDGKICIYDLSSSTYIIRKIMSGYCIYDMVSLGDGRLMICGGVSGIALAQKKVPRGFIAILDEQCNIEEIAWKGSLRFAWSLTKDDSGKVYASVFNGYNSRILEYTDGNWKKRERIKGLVHEIVYDKNGIYYSGANGIRYKNTGIAGWVENNKHQRFNGTGCIWSMKKKDDEYYAVSESGSVLVLRDNGNEIYEIPLPGGKTLYDLHFLTSRRILVAGHGKGVYMIELNNNLSSSTEIK